MKDIFSNVFYVGLVFLIIGLLIPKRYAMIRTFFVFVGLIECFGILGFIIAIIVTPFLNARVIRFNTDIFNQQNDEIFTEAEVVDEDGEETFYSDPEEDASDRETAKAHMLLDNNVEVIDADFEEVDD